MCPISRVYSVRDPARIDNRRPFTRTWFGSAQASGQSATRINQTEAQAADSLTPVTWRSRRRSFAAIFALFVLLGVSPQVVGDSAETYGVHGPVKTAILAVYEDDLMERLDQMTKWHATKIFLLTTTMSVTFLGAIVAALQTFKSGWARVFAAAFGILITTLTGINNSVFQHDYKTYDDRITEAEKLANQIQIHLIKLKDIEDSQVFDEELQKFGKLFDQFMELGKGMTPMPLFASARSSPHWSLIPSAYARESSRFVEIVAEGRGRNLDHAKEQAWSNFTREATQRLEVIVADVLKSEDANWAKMSTQARKDSATRIAVTLIPLRRVVDTQSNLTGQGDYSYKIKARFDLDFVEQTIRKIPVPSLPKEPSIVKIAPGCFQMGTPEPEVGRFNDEQLHQVCVKGFSLATKEVTFREYDSFADETGRPRPNDQGWGRGERPVVNVSWNDATAYAEWLSSTTGKDYRLPTEAEWEYAARAGTSTAFWTGDCIDTKQANYKGTSEYANCATQGNTDRRETVAAGSLPSNPWGLHEILGNVWEWTCSAYSRQYDGNELHCAKGNLATQRVRRGGSWSNSAQHLRAGRRYFNRPSHETSDAGFRLALD